jgi:hypothetical protein
MYIPQTELNINFHVGIHKTWYTAISIKVVHEKSGKVEYERERLLGIVNKLTRSPRKL